MRSYADLSDLKPALGLSESSTGQDARLAMALVLATAWVDHRLGLVPPDGEDVWDGWDPDGDPAPALDIVSGAPAARVAATIAAAVRFYKSPDVPFGAAGGLGDMAVYVARGIPEAEVILLGRREAWGIA